MAKDQGIHFVIQVISNAGFKAFEGEALLDLVLLVCLRPLEGHPIHPGGGESPSIYSIQEEMEDLYSWIFRMLRERHEPVSSKAYK
ncbi:unnamed protein product [Toxocara canis]|uniref:Uncharacterized protein n=1 Tax=Toxocara canis TaxID=6265 RepID=A0A183VAI2_TOXCA|nr:unnamed protein product [Toxocara canis]